MLIRPFIGQMAILAVDAFLNIDRGLIWPKISQLFYIKSLKLFVTKYRAKISWSKFAGAKALKLGLELCSKISALILVRQHALFALLKAPLWKFVGEIVSYVWIHFRMIKGRLAQFSYYAILFRLFAQKTVSHRNCGNILSIFCYI